MTAIRPIVVTRAKKAAVINANKSSSEAPPQRMVNQTETVKISEDQQN